MPHLPFFLLLCQPIYNPVCQSCRSSSGAMSLLRCSRHVRFTFSYVSHEMICPAGYILHLIIVGKSTMSTTRLSIYPHCSNPYLYIHQQGEHLPTMPSPYLYVHQQGEHLPTMPSPLLVRPSTGGAFTHNALSPTCTSISRGSIYPQCPLPYLYVHQQGEHLPTMPPPLLVHPSAGGAFTHNALSPTCTSINRGSIYPQCPLPYLYVHQQGKHLPTMPPPLLVCPSAGGAFTHNALSPTCTSISRGSIYPQCPLPYLYVHQQGEHLPTMPSACLFRTSSAK